MERFKTFTVLIASLTRNIRKIKTEEMAKWKLKSPHVSCLYYLYQRKSLTSKEICEICEEDKANISRSIEYLEENGYIKCKSEMRKRYKKQYELTEKGYEIGKSLSERIDYVLLRASEGVSEEERLIMYKSLMLINDNLQKLNDEYAD